MRFPILAAAVLAGVLVQRLPAQSLAANPSEDRLGGPITVGLGWWYTRIADRGPLQGPTAITHGPSITFRGDVHDYISLGINANKLVGDIEGNLVDPYVEIWLTPPGEKRPVYAGVYVGYHWSDFKYVGSNPFFTFPDGRRGDFRDNGFFGGVEGWVRIADNWNLKGTIGWYPQKQDASFFDSSEMHVSYAVGVGFRASSELSFSVVGAISPLADDALLIIGGTWDF